MKFNFNHIAFAALILPIILGQSIYAMMPNIPEENGLQRKSYCTQLTQYAYALYIKTGNFIRACCHREKPVYDPLDEVIYGSLTYRDLASGAYQARTQEIFQAMERAQLNIPINLPTAKTK